MLKRVSYILIAIVFLVLLNKEAGVIDFKGYGSLIDISLVILLLIVLILIVIDKNKKLKANK